MTELALVVCIAAFMFAATLASLALLTDSPARWHFSIHIDAGAEPADTPQVILDTRPIVHRLPSGLWYYNGNLVTEEKLLQLQAMNQSLKRLTEGR